MSFRIIVRINDIHPAVDYLLVTVAARNAARSRVLRESDTHNTSVLHNKEVEFEFAEGEIRVNEPFYACVTILGHAPGWSTCKIGKNSPEHKPENIELPLRNIAEYWRYVEEDNPDPILDVDEDWIFNP